MLFMYYAALCILCSVLYTALWSVLLLCTIVCCVLFCSVLYSVCAHSTASWLQHVIIVAAALLLQREKSRLELALQVVILPIIVVITMMRMMVMMMVMEVLLIHADAEDKKSLAGEMLKTGFNKFSTKIDRNAILLLQETRGKISKHFTGNLFQQNVIAYINGSLLKRKISYKSALVEIMLLREIFCRSNQTQPVQWKPSKSSFAPLLPKKRD